MSVTLAKSAGFCFGVSRAVELVEQAAAAGKKVATLGPIIHNRHQVGRFEQMGVSVIAEPEEAVPGSTVIIRSHGVSRSVQQRDYQDTHREVAPLKMSRDSIKLDTSELDIDGVVAAMKEIIAKKVGQ